MNRDVPTPYFRVKEWVENGFSRDEAKEWHSAGFSIESAKSFKKINYTPKKAKEYIIEKIKKQHQESPITINLKTGIYRSQDIKKIIDNEKKRTML